VAAGDVAVAGFLVVVDDVAGFLAAEAAGFLAVVAGFAAVEVWATAIEARANVRSRTTSDFMDKQC
jgi:hypothetical protein